MYANIRFGGPLLPQLGELFPNASTGQDCLLERGKSVIIDWSISSYVRFITSPILDEIEAQMVDIRIFKLFREIMAKVKLGRPLGNNLETL
jgi:hypothetical protein